MAIHAGPAVRMASGFTGGLPCHSAVLRLHLDAKYGKQAARRGITAITGCDLVKSGQA
jgi:hypothetical protein